MIAENEIIEILGNIFNVQIVEYNNKMNIYKIGIWLNGLEINNNEIELNMISDKLNKLNQFIAKAIIAKNKEKKNMGFKKQIEELEILLSNKFGVGLTVKRYKEIVKGYSKVKSLKINNNHLRKENAELKKQLRLIK